MAGQHTHVYIQQPTIYSGGGGAPNGTTVNSTTQPKTLGTLDSMIADFDVDEDVGGMDDMDRME